MKKILLMCLSLLTLICNGQMNSEFGYKMPVHGVFKILVIYAEVDFSACSNTNPFNYSTNPHWLPGQLPDYKDQIFDVSLPAMGPTMGTVTDYYAQASCGDYIVLGDYLPQVVTVTAPSNFDITNSTTLMLNVGDVLAKLNSSTTSIVTAHNQTLTDFDKYDMYASNAWWKKRGN